MTRKTRSIRLYVIALKGVGLIDGTASQGRNLAIHNMISVNADYDWDDLKRAGYYVVSGTFRYQP